jgi:hypothetical protein
MDGGDAANDFRLLGWRQPPCSSTANVCRHPILLSVQVIGQAKHSSNLPSLLVGQVAIHDHRHLSQRAPTRLQRLQPGIDRLNGAVDGLAEALFRGLLLDPVAALCDGNDPEWRRYISGAEERCIGLVIGEILIDAPERVVG